ncbi:MAG: LuxR C-terminal-related transcriptional regulator [Bacillota bacterium]
MDRIRLLIVNEDSMLRRGLAAIFSSEIAFDVVGDFSLEEAVDKSIQLQPDVVLIDINDEKSSHWPKVIQLKSECPCSLILALVGDEHCDRLADLLSAQSIDGCVPKGIIRGCLVKTVELACRAGLLCLPGSFKKVVSFTRQDKVFSNGDFKCGLPGNGEYLTKREMEILQLMARNYSNREIGHKLFISEPTVKTHVSSILRKLGQNNRAQAIVYSYKIGLVNEVSGCV